MPDQVYGYDDAEVTLGDGAIDVGGVKVRGSCTFIRDPRLGRLTDTMGRLKLRQAERWHMLHPKSDDKWCFVCGLTRPKSYFSPRKDTWDKLEPRCKMCENERKRKAYRDVVGRPVRKYEHKETA